MSLAKQYDFITEQDYLKAELESEIKHEYDNGAVTAMSGASRNHVRLTGNILAGLHQRLLNGPCEPFASDMKVKTPSGQFRYPDVLVTGDNEFIHDGYVTETPVLIVEVISRSTRKLDEQVKKLEYFNIPTLKEYILIEQDYVDVMVYRKSDNWRSTHYFLDETVPLESIGTGMKVSEIYYRVENQDMQEFNEQQQL